MSVQASPQLEAEFRRIYPQVEAFTMVDWMKCYNLYKGLTYVLDAGVPGSLVECGVWRGGCCMLMALTAMAREQADRDLYLYDTFQGMTAPSAEDIRHTGEHAGEKWRTSQRDDHNAWCYAPLDDVKRNMAATGYPAQRLHFTPGPVEETLPAAAPDQIALLRLDTDFYVSSLHELEHLYPRVADGGVVIFDDYNCWEGQKRAVHEYFEAQGAHVMLTCVSTSAMGVKTPPFGWTHAERERRVSADPVAPGRARDAA